MTWNSRDALPKQRRNLPGTEQAPPKATDASQDAKTTPEAIPTFAASRALQWDEDEERGAVWPPEFERSLGYEGIWPQREWAAWGKWMTRGVMAQ